MKGWILTLVILLVVGYISGQKILYFLALPPALVLLRFLWKAYTREVRRKALEKHLPDLLLLISSNIKSGMTIDRAVISAARPEFGILGEEIRKVGRALLAGKTLREAFERFARESGSREIKRVVGLIIEGAEAGGEIASLLSAVAREISLNRLFREETKAYVRTYAIFIGIAAILAAPILYAISLSFVEVSNRLVELMKLPQGQAPVVGVKFFLRPKAIDVTELQEIIIGAIIITAFFSSLILAVLSGEKEIEGLRVFPILATAAVLLFLLVHKVLSLFLLGLLG